MTTATAAEPLVLERFFVEGLAHASYLVGRRAYPGAPLELAVVDPKRDVEDYLAAAARLNGQIRVILVTHAHADYVGGHTELAARTGAAIVHSAAAPAQYPFHGLRHNEELAVGGLVFRALETPGHTPDSLSYYVDTGDRRLLFSGDVLFVGDVGRPDLVDMKVEPRVLAGALYDSLHQVLYRLPDDTVVYPAHGAGSLCGRHIGAEPTTTIGQEKLTNWANQFESREAFIEAMVSNLPDRPLHFYHDPFVNLAGPRPLAEVPKPRYLEPAELVGDLRHAVVVDTRPAAEYGAMHLQGSLNIGLDSPVFSTWVGHFVRPEDDVVLVVDEPADAERAWLELARIGYERAVGYLTPDEDRWMAAGLAIAETPQLVVCDVEGWVAAGRALVDVRTPSEFAGGHVPGARNIPLGSLLRRLAEVPTGPVAVMCGGGYRASLAASLLERAGRRHVQNVEGGWAGWTKRSCAEPDALDLQVAPAAVAA